MPAKRATKTANICANIYEGVFQVDFDCVGADMCRYVICHLMPPDGSEECAYREHGTCLNPHAKAAALEVLGRKIKKELKGLEDFEG